MLRLNSEGTLDRQRDYPSIGSSFSKRNTMVDLTAKLEAALRVNAALRVQAGRLIAAYVAPGSDRGRHQ
jgi:hypothetical protein